MEIQPTVNPVTVSDCEHCNTSIEEIDSFCRQCGFPVKGTLDEKSLFHNRVRFQEEQLKKKNTDVRNGRTSLFVIAGLFAFYAAIIFFTEDHFKNTLAAVTVYLILSVIFLLLANWSIQKPVAALISGLSLYAALELLNIVMEPATLGRGILVKIFIIVYLTKALQSAFEAQKLSKALKVK
jgi:hypothetical protein